MDRLYTQMISLSDTAVGFYFMDSHFKQARPVVSPKVCRHIPFISVFTLILCVYTQTEVVVSLSVTVVGFNLMHPHFKQAILADISKVCHFFHFVSVFTRILCLHTDGSGGSSRGLPQGLSLFPFVSVCLLVFYVYTQIWKW